MARPPQPGRSWRAAEGAAGSPAARAGERGSPAREQQPCLVPGSPARRQQPKAAQRPLPGCRRDARAHPVHAPSPGGTGATPHPSPSLCRLCFAVTDRQAPAPRTINYSRALFLNIDVKSKFPACPLPAFQMQFSRRKEPGSRGAIRRCRRARHGGGGKEAPPPPPAGPGAAGQGQQEPPRRLAGLGASPPAPPPSPGLQAPISPPAGREQGGRLTE